MIFCNVFGRTLLARKLNRNYNHEKEKSSKEDGKENEKKTSIVFLKNPASFGGIFYCLKTYHMDFLMKLNAVCF